MLADDALMNYLRSILVGVAAFLISMFLFYLAIVFGGRTADFILFSRYCWIVRILSSLVLAMGFYLRARRASRARTAPIQR
jgi:uncharacterized membrane protein YfhO